ncbi:MAG: hypothetical protein NTX08_02665 [Sphingobacteriales bacterium]|nr:hypothetical protein [Sphingobacteriales bacterium]
MTEEDEIYEAFDHTNKFKSGELTGKKIIEAIKTNNIYEVKRLLSLSAEEGGLIILRLTQKDENGKSAIQIAEENGNKDILDLLRG